MTNSHSSSDDPLDAIVAEYYEARDAGRPLTADELAARHPELASQIRQFIGDIENVAAVLQQRPGNSAHDETLAPSGEQTAAIRAGSLVRYFGDYEILEELGSGGMGVVYKARQAKLKKIVALKMIKMGQLASEHEVRRFQAEARAAAKLDHPGIVAVHEVGVHHQHHYYAMDYVAGDSLSKLHRDEPVAARRAAELVKQMAEAMHYAHGQGIVHRDLKPANVLLTTNGTPRITDFGLAKRLWSDEESAGVTMTETGQVLGTAGYMSPEQAAGKTRLVGPPADIYALGAILYALLTGRAPFVGESQADTILQVIQKEPVSPRVLNPSIARDLETICLKCLEKEPHKRYGTAQLLADDLQRFLEGRPVLARPLSVSARAWRWGRRNPWIAGLSTAVALSLLAGTIVSSALAVIAERQRKKVVAANEVIQKNLHDLEKKDKDLTSALDEANWQLYRLRMTRMEQLWREKDWGSLERLLAESVPAPGELDLRGWEWHFLNAQVAKRFWRVNTRPEDMTPFDWDRITGQLAVLVRGRVEIWLPSERRLLKTIDVPDSVANGEVAYSPDGRRLAVEAHGMKVHVIDTTTGDIDCTLHITQYSPGKKYITGLHWSPQGDYVAVTSSYERIGLWKIAPNPEQVAWLEDKEGKPGPNEIHWVDSDTCVTTDRGGDMQFWQTADWKEPIRRQNVVQGYCHDAAWNPDGKHVAFASAKVVIANADGTQVHSLPDQGARIEQLCWLDNQRLVTANSAHEVRIVHIDQSMPDEVYRLHPSQIQKLCVGPGSQIASAAVGDVVKVWSQGEVTSEHIAFPGGGDMTKIALGCAWHPNTNTLAMLTPGRATTIAATWSPADTQSVSIPFADNVNGVQWNANGDALTLELGTGKWQTLPWPYDGATSLASSPQQMGSLHAYSAGRRFRIENEADWSKIELVDLHGEYARVAAESGGIYTFAWHPREPRVALAEHGRIRLLGPSHDPPTRAFFGYAERLQAVRALAWSRNGDQLLAGSTSGTVHVFDGSTLSELNVLSGHTGQVSAVAWSHDDRRIVSAGRDGYIRWWDAARGIELFKMPVEGKAVIRELRFSADGQWLAGRTEVGQIHVWTTSGNVTYEETKESPTPQINADPSNVQSAWLQSARLHRRWHRWGQAADDYQQFILLEPNDLGARQDLAITSLAAGREADYFRHCREIETQLITMTTPNIFHTRAGRILSLRPEGFADGDRLLTMVVKMAEMEPTKWEFVHPQIPILFRMKRYDDALREARRIPPASLYQIVRAPLHAWEAMILWRLDRRPEARVALDLAQRYINDARNSQGKSWGVGDEIIEAEIVLREAEALVKPDAVD